MLHLLFLLVCYFLDSSGLIIGDVTEYSIGLPSPMDGQIAYYDSLRDIVWLFGGKNETDKTGNVITFDYQANSFNETYNFSKPNLGYPAFSQSNNGFVIDDTLYFIDQNIYYLMSYELSTGVSNITLWNFPLDDKFKGISGDKNNKLIYIAGGQSNAAWVYNITSETYVNLSDSISGHSKASLVWNNDILCMFGSDAHKKIDCVNTSNTNSSWYVLSDEFIEESFHFYAIPFKDNFMIIYGGRFVRSGWEYSNGIYVYDISLDLLYLSNVKLITNVSSISVAYIPTTDEVFIFGGVRGSANGGQANFTQISSLTTGSPTLQPTITSSPPTLYPTLKSLQLGKVSLYPAVLPGRLDGAIAHYDETRDLIWIFGGRNETDDYKFDVITFDYKTDTFNLSKPKLGHKAFYNSNNGIVIDDVLYFIDKNTFYLMSYNLETGVTNSNVSPFVQNDSSKAIAGDVNNKIIYLSGGFVPSSPIVSVSSWAYNVTSDKITLLPNSTTGHNKAAAVWNNNLLCMFGDERHAKIDCLDTLSLTNWNVLQDEFNHNYFFMYAIPFKDNWMIMYGGRIVNNGWQYTNSIYYYDISLDKLYLSRFGLIANMSNVAVANVHTTDQVFILGGNEHSSEGGEANFTQYHSLSTLAPSMHPTLYPTMYPSNTPTITSFSPTMAPTVTRLILGNVTLYPTILPYKLDGAIAVYDEIRDIIWIFGGRNDSNDNVNTVLTFDYNTGEFNSSKPKMEFAPYHPAKNGILIDDILYYIDQKEYVLMSYNLETGVTNTNVAQYLSNDNFKCISADYSNKIIYFSGGQNSFKAWAYNITTNETVVLPDSTIYHHKGFSGWNSNILCLFGNTPLIECLDTLSSSVWYRANSEFHLWLQRSYTIPFKNNWLIFYGSMYSNSSIVAADFIYVYNIVYDDLYISESHLVDKIGHVAVAHVTATDEIFIFGGMRDKLNGSRVNITQYSSLSTFSPTLNPTLYPTLYPTTNPTVFTSNPSAFPTIIPTREPSTNPSEPPTNIPSKDPTINPTNQPSINPSENPTNIPTITPTKYPTNNPTSEPSINPSMFPTINPTSQPSVNPSENPTNIPTVTPTKYPTNIPSGEPSANPSTNPTNVPTFIPTNDPTMQPTSNPTNTPSNNPTNIPTFTPSKFPSVIPSNQPSNEPTLYPTNSPTINKSGSSSFETQAGISIVALILSIIIGFLVLSIVLYVIVKRWKEKQNKPRLTLEKIDSNPKDEIKPPKIELQQPGVATVKTDHDKHAKEQVTPGILDDHQVTAGQEIQEEGAPKEIEGAETRLIIVNDEKTKKEDFEEITEDEIIKDAKLNNQISTDSNMHDDMYEPQLNVTPQDITPQETETPQNNV